MGGLEAPEYIEEPVGDGEAHWLDAQVRREGEELGGPATARQVGGHIEVAAGVAQAVDGAVARVHAVFEDFLDDHKERAYASAFDEPARFYFDARGDHGARDHVKVHGSNWYAVALHEALGVSTPYVPEEDDPHKMAVAAFWGGLHPSAWELFSQRDHFGKEFEGIPALRRKSKHLKGHVDAGVFDAQRPKALRAKLQTNANARRQFAPYAERFAHFFSTEFLARSAFETLNSEV